MSWKPASLVVLLSTSLILVVALLLGLESYPATASSLEARLSQPRFLLVCSTPVFINEFHYENDGADADEFVEIVGPAGTSLSGWSIVLYNGNGGAPYDTIDLNAAIPDQDNGFGTYRFWATGMQNGSPDGLALVNPSNGVEQFLAMRAALWLSAGQPMA